MGILPAAAARPQPSALPPRSPSQSDLAACDLPATAGETVDALSKWAMPDAGWDRVLSSVSLYDIARHAYQQAQYDEAIIALEESLALRLFAYVDQPTLDKWQQVRPRGSARGAERGVAGCQSCGKRPGAQQAAARGRGCSQVLRRSWGQGSWRLPAVAGLRAGQGCEV